MLTFFRYFTFADAGTGSVSTPLLPNPMPDKRRVEVYARRESVHTGSADMALVTSMDTQDVPLTVIAASTIGAGLNIFTANSGVGNYLQITLTPTSASPAIVPCSRTSESVNGFSPVMR